MCFLTPVISASLPLLNYPEVNKFPFNPLYIRLYLYPEVSVHLREDMDFVSDALFGAAQKCSRRGGLRYFCEGGTSNLPEEGRR